MGITAYVDNKPILTLCNVTTFKQERQHSFSLPVCFYETAVREFFFIHFLARKMEYPFFRSTSSTSR
jgi:hypothetical protein